MIWLLQLVLLIVGSLVIGGLFALFWGVPILTMLESFLPGTPEEVRMRRKLRRAIWFDGWAFRTFVLCATIFVAVGWWRFLMQ